MTSDQALALLRSEVQAGSPAGQALVVLLPAFELTMYRQAQQATDPVALARAAGGGAAIGMLHKTLLSVTQAKDDSAQAQSLL